MTALSTDDRGTPPMTGPAGSDDPRTFLTFAIGGQFFALSVDPVREILDQQPLALLPEAPADVIGLIDVRGEGVMVMDIAARLGVMGGSGRDRRIIVLERPEAGQRPVGVLADQVHSVVELPATAIEAPPAAGRGRPGLLQGVARLGGHLTLVLDHRNLLGDAAPADDMFDFGP